MQRDIDFEVLLSDDCSTDSTLSIMKGYMKKYPKIIKLLKRTENLGMCLNMYDAYHKARGEYIAILEGDDFWTDPLKLKKQADILDENKKYSGVFNHYDFLQGETRFSYKNQLKDLINKNKDEISIEDLIKCNYIGNFSSCMFRAEILQSIDKSVFEFFFVADWLTGFLAIDKGGPLFFMKEKMSVYRLHLNSQWYSYSDIDKKYEVYKARVLYNYILEFKYDDLFRDYYIKNIYRSNKDSKYYKKFKKYKKFTIALLAMLILIVILH